MIITNRLLKKVLRDCKRFDQDRHVPGAADAILIAFPFNKQHQSIAYRVFAPILKAEYIKTCCLIVEKDRGLLSDIKTTRIIELAIPDDLKKQPLLSESVNQQLREYDFAAALDLNVGFHPYTAAAVLKSRAVERIGFQTEYSDHFFNIQISKREEEPIESSYRYMLRFIKDSGLFRKTED